MCVEPDNRVCSDPRDPCFGVPERFINRDRDYDSSGGQVMSDEFYENDDTLDDWNP